MFLRKFLMVALLLVVGATAANAYTIVMRSGRRVEIPNTFTLTKSALTYETAPGIQVTLQLVGIDIAATERINGQTPGSFMQTATMPAPTEPPASPPPTQTRPAANRTITNQDLEAYRRARIEGEKQRAELGLPSVEERRRELEEIENRAQEQVQKMRTREEINFWKERATQLETQMMVNRAQINTIDNPYGVGLVTTGFPFAFDGFRGFHGSNRFRFNPFGFNNFSLNSQFPVQSRQRLRFSIPNSGGRGHSGGRGGRR